MLASVLIPLLFPLACSLAQASEDSQGVAVEQEADFRVVKSTPEERLNVAVRKYQTGSPQEAQALVANIVNDRSFDNEALRQRARVFLGEVLYLQQSEEEARRVFEAILTLEPDYLIDPFEHPPDVCGFFETIRTYIRPPEAPPIATPVPPTPVSAYLGFGLYQMKHKQRSLGASMAIGQATFGLLSAVMFAGLLDDRDYTAGMDDERKEVQTRKAVQWGATAGFYGFWGWSAIDANRHWRTNVEMHSVSRAAGRARADQRPDFHVRFSFPTR